MSSRLIATKLHVPTAPRRGLVRRPRLFERLERAAEARVTLVSAPAGFGKTTLVASWLAEKPARGRAVAWLSLDPADNDPRAFWRYLATALHGAVPSVGAGDLDLSWSSAVPVAPGLTELLNELAAAPEEVWLVLDDYHLIHDVGIRDGLAFLLEHLPARVHMVLLTRADPDLPLARWRVRAELVEIRAADLRFTPEEAGAYLDAVPGVALDAVAVAVLAERTEGWIAALQLAALSLAGRQDVRGFIAGFAGDNRYIVDYLVEEVLQHQPPDLREFLLGTAVLDRLTGPLCDAVTGRTDGRDVLVALERANLFTVALDDRREWYRYHHLFADVLRARLLTEQPHEVRRLHQRASQWYESHSLVEEAIGHALTGQDFPRAGHLMELALPAIRRDRHDATMHTWLQALPDETVRRSPVLGVFYGSMLMVSGDLDAAGERFDDAERTLAALPGGWAAAGSGSDELPTLPATIAIYRASIAHARGDGEATVRHARRALDLAGPADHLALAGATGFLGLAAWAQGDVLAALESFTDTVASLAAAGNHVDELTSTVVLADLWLVAGRPSRARQLYERALQRAQAWGAAVTAASAELEVGLSELDTEVGSLDSAAGHLDRAAALNRAMTESSCRWSVAAGLLAHARGQSGEALDDLDRAEQRHRPGFSPDVRPIPALQARIRISQGRLPAAADWARERAVTVLEAVSYPQEFAHLTLVRLLLAQHRAHPAADQADQAGQAVGLLGRLEEAALIARRDGSLLEIRMLHALARDLQGDRAQAMELLADALAQAPEPAGHVQLLLNEGAPMLSLLREMHQQGVGEEHPGRLLTSSAARAKNPSPPGQRRATASADSLSERELHVLKLLDSALTVPEIGRRLFVSHNTVRTHTKHIFTKLDVRSRRAAVLRARERGLL